jgi:hypothetical protein
MLVCDSYYLDSTGHEKLLEDDVRFAASVTRKRFYNLAQLVEPAVEKPGQFEVAYNNDTHELFALVWDKNEDIGKKYLLTNAFRFRPGFRPPMKHVRPGYDAYGFMFNKCDIFNRSLHDCTWPHRNGSGGRHGVDHNVHDYFFSCLLRNVFNVIGNEDMSFQNSCIELSNVLYQRSFKAQ